MDGKYTGQAAGNLGSYTNPQAMQIARVSPPDFIIKYELAPSDSPRPSSTTDGLLEEAIHGSEGDAIEAVQRLVENGRTTPGRVRIYANLNPSIMTTVQFAPLPPRTR